MHFIDYFVHFIDNQYSLAVPNLTNGSTIMKTKLLYLFFGVFALTMTSCETESSSESNDAAFRQNLQALNPDNQFTNPDSALNNAAIILPGNSPCLTTDLLAGDRYDSGDVRVYFDAEKVYVELAAEPDWFIKKTNVYIGNLQLVPLNRRGVPIIAQFPISGNYADGAQSLIYFIPRSSLPKCFCLSVYAEVFRTENGQIVQSERAWSQGERFGTSSTAMYLNVCQSACTN